LWNLMLIERRLGRVRTRQWGPRVIDLDLLLYGEEVVDEDDLQVPHPLMTQRSFVMVPLVEIEPLLVHPVTNQTMLSILQRLGPTRW
jgi:2-amino-4-hydroxy-6-hydroxymethyldihydropteridine diphosphokinase